MDSNLRVHVCGVVLMLFSYSWNIRADRHVFKVTDFGAIPDGKTDSKLAFEGAWAKACKMEGGTVAVPAGIYGVSGATFLGPCNGPTNFMLNGTLVASRIPTPNSDYWIMFAKLNNLSIFGNGTFNGNGAFAWAHSKFRKVTSLKLMLVTDVVVRGITSVNSKMFHIVLHKGKNVVIHGVRIRAPDDSPNTDGIHVGVSHNVRIRNAHIGTGDDCISLGHGSTNISIAKVFCGPGHGISIGSLGKNEDELDVRDIRVTNCTFTGTTNGVRIKTVAPSPPNKASAITFQHLVMNHVKNPIIIDQHYCPHANCTRLQEESSISIEDVKFIDIHGSSITPVGVRIECSKRKPCKDINLSGVELTYRGEPAQVLYYSADVNLV